MIKASLAVFCCLMVVSCSYPAITVYRGLEQENESFNLLNIRIQRWEKLKFSGLLALQRKGDKLFYAVLDSSGITLMEAEIGAGGEHNLLDAKKEMKASELPQYLSTALYRTFGLDPEDYPCSGDGLVTLCLKKKDGRWRKEATAGPFTLWMAEGVDPEGDEVVETIYQQPWSGVQISFKRLNRE